MPRVLLGIKLNTPCLGHNDRARMRARENPRVLEENLGSSTIVLELS